MPDGAQVQTRVAVVPVGARPQTLSYIDPSAFGLAGKTGTLSHGLAIGKELAEPLGRGILSAAMIPEEARRLEMIEEQRILSQDEKARRRALEDIQLREAQLRLAEAEMTPEERAKREVSEQEAATEQKMQAERRLRAKEAKQKLADWRKTTKLTVQNLDPKEAEMEAAELMWADNIGSKYGLTGWEVRDFLKMTERDKATGSPFYDSERYKTDEDYAKTIRDLRSRRPTQGLANEDLTVNADRAAQIDSLLKMAFEEEAEKRKLQIKTQEKRIEKSSKGFTFGTEEEARKTFPGAKIKIETDPETQKPVYIVEEIPEEAISPENMNLAASMIANYEAPLSQFRPRGMKGYGEYISLVNKAKEINPNYVPVYSEGELKSVRDNVRRLQSMLSLIGHMNDLEDVSKRVPRTRFPVINNILQGIYYHTGDPDVKAYEAAALAVAEEFGNVMGGGGGNALTDHKLKVAMEQLKSTQSDAQLKATLNEMKKLLTTRAHEITKPYVESRKDVLRMLETYKEGDEEMPIVREIEATVEGRTPMGKKVQAPSRAAGQAAAGKNEAAFLIREDLKAGRISREEARKRLKDLGFK